VLIVSGSGIYNGFDSSVKFGSSALAAIIPEKRFEFSPAILSPI
jgi:hypothetical protein